MNNSNSAADCEGHGTHVASTAVGRTVGVAKEARIVAVRVLDCAGSGENICLIRHAENSIHQMWCCFLLILGLYFNGDMSV